MQVLLLKDVDQLGQAGEVKRVGDGYARNYLFSRGWAVPATPGAVKQAEQQRRVQKSHEATTVTFQARAGEGDRLYGSITNANIAEALELKIGREVDRRKIDLKEPLKELGAHAVTIRLAPQAEAKITVVIEREA
jgi:large subunit ribosomal protein L9